MTIAAAPLVILVHGAWHGAWCWASLQSELDRRGLASLAVDLPGHGASAQPLSDLYGDAAAVQATVNAQRGPVMLVGHSYGGAVITEAGSQCPNVVDLVYIAAFVPDVGEAVLAMSQSMPRRDVALNRAIVIGDDGNSTINPELAQAAFYTQCDPQTVAANIARLSPQPLSTMTQPVTAAAWKSIPNTYIACTQDQAVPYDHQVTMAQRCARIETLETDHSPFASTPIETADILTAIAMR